MILREEKGRLMKVFVSYTRDKDEFVAVSQFTKHFANELVGSVPGSTVFQDTENIGPSDPFTEIIKRELDGADVLLVLVSPAWLASRWCRKEFDLFSAKKTAQGQPRCILPVLWFKTPALEKPGRDRIARKLASLEFDDWRDLRHEAWDNPEPRRRVARLVEKVVTKLGNQKPIEVEKAPARKHRPRKVQKAKAKKARRV